MSPHSFSCSISLEMQLLIQSLMLQLLLSCPISVPPAQPALNIRLKTNSLVMVETAVTLQTGIRIMSNRRQSHRVSTAHLKCCKHPEQSLSATEMRFPCRRSGAATEIGSASILGWINQLLQLSITCREFCCTSIC